MTSILVFDTGRAAGGGAIGACVQLEGPEGECTTVVGVVEDVAREGFRDAPGLTYYVPQRPGWYPRRFGMLAVGVAAVGLYSVLAFDVAGRTRELGI